MFKTDRNAELLPELSKGSSGVQFWSFVEQEVNWPWFYLQIVEDEGREAFRSMLMVPTPSLLEQILAAQTRHVWLEQAQLVTPHHVNKRGRWMMEPLQEVYSVQGPQGNDLGYRYMVEGGQMYSTSESEPADSRHTTNLVFSAALHLRS